MTERRSSSFSMWCPSPSWAACTSRRRTGARARGGPRGRARRPRRSALVQVDRAVVDRGVRRGALHRAEQLARGHVDTTRNVSRDAERSDTRRRGSPRAAAGRRSAALDELAPAGEVLAVRAHPRAEDVAVGRGVDRPLVRGAQQVARWISSDSWSRIADSTGRSRNSSGWRQKNWSSASSPATYTARPRPRRPARPHICRREATVPGNVTTTAASSAPMSIPSSSAFVVTTARTSPA
jgi:hypothetical protein